MSTGSGDRGEDGGMRGVSMALVTDNKDPKGLARVKVKYPWRAANDESYWARLAAPMAGPDRGTYFLPDEGDEVLVAFENGDFESPYVLGGLWNGKREPPEDNSEETNDIRTIRSRAGHAITIDEADDGGMTVETAGGQVIELSDESGSESVTITDESGTNELTFDPTSGEVSLSAGGTLSIEATNIELSADGNLSIESSAILTLKGSLVKIN